MKGVNHIYNDMCMKTSFTLIVLCLLLLASCGGNKRSDEIIVERDQVEEHRPGVIGMAANTQSDNVNWISGSKYTYIITRTKDTSLPKVKNHDQDYYDNTINLVIKRDDGSICFEKKFTKKNFESVVPKSFYESGVLLGMNFYKAEGNYLKFVTSIGSPDENNEEFYLVSLTVDNLGSTKCEAYQAPKEEDVDE